MAGVSEEVRPSLYPPHPLAPLRAAPTLALCRGPPPFAWSLTLFGPSTCPPLFWVCGVGASAVLDSLPSSLHPFAPRGLYGALAAPSASWGLERRIARPRVASRSCARLGRANGHDEGGTDGDRAPFYGLVKRVRWTGRFVSSHCYTSRKTVSDK